MDFQLTVIKERIAVILAAYNGVSWLREQVDSILKQDGNLNINLFISVDLSVDGTEQLANQIAKEDARVIVLPHGVHCGGAAKNFFRLIRDVDFSSFDYVSFSDQDDIWFPDKLLRAINVFCAEGCDAYSSNVEAFWPDGRRLVIDKSQPQRQWDFLFEGAGPGCTFVLKRELATAVQNLVCSRWIQCQEIGFHDWLIYAFARSKGYKWIIDPYPTMLYRQHCDNVVGANSGVGAFMQRVHKVTCGWALMQAIQIVHLVDMERSEFVAHWINGSRYGAFWLSIHSGQCRRRLRDRFFFAVSCLTIFLIGFKF